MAALERRQIVRLITLALVPIEVIFWAGFAVPIPPLFAVARLACSRLVVGLR